MPIKRFRDVTEGRKHFAVCTNSVSTFMATSVPSWENLRHMNCRRDEHPSPGTSPAGQGVKQSRGVPMISCLWLCKTLQTTCEGS